MFNWKPLLEIPKELIYKPLLFRAYYFEECFYQEFIYSRYSENPFRLHGITGKPLKTIGVDDCDIFDDESYDFSKIEYLDISILNN